MREIKFRVWDKNSKKIYHIIGFILVHNQIRIWYYDKETILNQSYHESNVIITQYAGLKDKNGKEIYEGDILQINDEEHEGNAKIVCVEYKRGGFVDSYFHRYIGDIKTYKIEIIGNIYENPELLKE